MTQPALQADTPAPDPNRTLVKTFLRAIEDGDLDTIIACYHPDVKHTEWPNALRKEGVVSGLEEIKAAFHRGKTAVKSQTFHINALICDGDVVAAECLWRGVLNVDFGKLQAGDTMTAHVCSVFELRDGKIYRQRNYDCFEPFA
jgi:ketosteroid isomerase-like protein